MTETIAQCLRRAGVALGLLVVVGFLVTARPARADDLAEAYAREEKILVVEQRALEAELKRARKSGASARQALTATIDTLGAELARLSAGEADGGPSPLVVRERVRKLSARDDAMEATAARMAQWLQTQGETPPSAKGPGRVPLLVDRMLARVEREGGLRVADAEVFGLDGVARRGPVLRVGDVAAVGWDAPYRPLVAAPDGTLRAVAGVAPIHSKGPDGVLLRAVLYDREHPMEAVPADPGPWARFQAGGPLMGVLALLGVGALLVALERVVVLGVAQLQWGRVRARAGAPTAASDRGVVRSLGGPLAAVAARGHRSTAEASERAGDALVVLREGLQARLSILAVVAAVAPLVGLLGTVTGMIATFSVLTRQGAGDPQALSGGISEALLTTQFGLAIAVPTILAHTAFRRWAVRLVAAVEAEALQRLYAEPELSPHATDASRDGAGDERVVPLDDSPASGRRGEPPTVRERAADA